MICDFMGFMLCVSAFSDNFVGWGVKLCLHKFLGGC